MTELKKFPQVWTRSIGRRYDFERNTLVYLHEHEYRFEADEKKEVHQQ